MTIALRLDSFLRESHPQRVLFGRRRLEDLPREVDALGASRSLLIGGGSASTVVDRAFRVLGGRVVSVFEHPQQHVPRSVADAAIDLSTESNADVLVCVGGGKAIGLAKAVARELRLPIVAVPTTLSGSEMTAVFGISEDGKKQTGHDPVVLPRVVIYDSELFRGLPRRVAGPSGMNALAHAIGALVNEGGGDPLIGMIAEESCRTIFEILHQFSEDGGRADTAEELAFAGHLGGYCLANAGVWFHHRVCHIIGGLYRLPHAPMHATLLPHNVTMLRKYDTGSYARLGKAIGSERPEEALSRLLTTLCESVSLHDIGMSESVVEQCAKIVADELTMFAETDVVAMVDAAARGTSPEEEWS